MSPWQIGASRINEAVRLREQTEHNRRYTATGLGVVDPNSGLYSLPMVESFNYPVIVNGLNKTDMGNYRTYIRKHDAARDKDWDWYRRALLPESNTSATNSGQVINQTKLNMRITPKNSRMKNVTGGGTSQQITPANALLTSTLIRNDLLRKLDKYAIKPSSLQEKLVTKPRIIRNNSQTNFGGVQRDWRNMGQFESVINNLTPQLLMWLDLQGISTENALTLQQGINEYLKSHKDNRRISEDNRWGNQSLSALNEILQNVPNNVYLLNIPEEDLIELYPTRREGLEAGSFKKGGLIPFYQTGTNKRGIEKSDNTRVKQIPNKGEYVTEQIPFGWQDFVPVLGTYREALRLDQNDPDASVARLGISLAGDLAGAGMIGGVVKAAGKAGRIQKALKARGYQLFTEDGSLWFRLPKKIIRGYGDKLYTYEIPNIYGGSSFKTIPTVDYTPAVMAPLVLTLRVPAEAPFFDYSK